MALPVCSVKGASGRPGSEKEEYIPRSQVLNQGTLLLLFLPIKGV